MKRVFRATVGVLLVGLSLTACQSKPKTPEELASMKKLGKLVLREQEQVFDQAMHRVMGRLQNDVA